jgi:AraC-like DNA-binding protein
MAVERIHSINPDRIIWCCADRGITLEELASELKISESTMERVMNNEDGMTFHQLSSARFVNNVRQHFCHLNRVCYNRRYNH